MLRVTTQMTGALAGTPYFATHYSGGVLQSDADAAVAAVDAFWGGVQSSITSSLTIDVLPEVEIVDTATGQTTGIFDTAGGTGVGTAGGDILSRATQGLIRWRTGTFVNGREVRGRTFLPGQVETNNTLSRPTAGIRATWQLAADTLISDMATAGSLIIYSPTHAQAVVVTSSSTWSEWAVLRSRRD